MACNRDIFTFNIPLFSKIAKSNAGFGVCVDRQLDDLIKKTGGQQSAWKGLRIHGA
jgi:hypothetical protein